MSSRPGLYNADAGRVRAALSARVTAQGSGLENLEGLQVVDVQLEGGRYEVPYLYLTVADPGSTALLPGEHVYNIEFDEQGRVDWLSPFGVRRGGRCLAARQSGLYRAGRRAHGERRADLRAARRPAGADAAGCHGRNAALPFHGRTGRRGGVRRSSTNRPAPRELAAGPVQRRRVRDPAGRQRAELEQAALAQAAEELNVLFAALLDGSYQAADFSSGPALDALRAWDPARPLPVAVTPGCCAPIGLPPPTRTSARRARLGPAAAELLGRLYAGRGRTPHRESQLCPHPAARGPGEPLKSRPCGTKAARRRQTPRRADSVSGNRSFHLRQPLMVAL